MFPFYMLLLLGVLLSGLMLLILAAFLFLKVKNKIVGVLVMMAGLACTLLPLLVLLFMMAVPTRG